MKEKKYAAEKIENFQAEVPMEEYVKECVDVATFLEFCKECSNYGKLWCCPPYTFDVEKDVFSARDFKSSRLKEVGVFSTEINLFIKLIKLERENTEETESVYLS